MKFLVVCADKISDFLYKSERESFSNKHFTFVVLDPDGNAVEERKRDIKEMGGKHEVADYNIRDALRNKLSNLKIVQNGAPESITIKLYDFYPVLEVWFFDERNAIFGLLRKLTSTEKQKFILCDSRSPFFPWLHRYYDYIDSRISKPL